MEIIYETNGKGFLGWIVELPGAYVRGKTREEACSKFLSEVNSYEIWLDLKLQDKSITKETIIQSTLMIEDADSDILLEYDKINYTSQEVFLYDCNLAYLSAVKLNSLYLSCTNKNIVDKTKVRTTFYGNVYATIQLQFEHVVKVQQYYLACIDTTVNIGIDFIQGRTNTIESIKNSYKSYGNRIYQNESELWTIRKVLRRLIWHDRIHARAIARMNNRLNMISKE